MDKIRCFGNKPNEAYYAEYHDREWGVPVHDDRKLFEFLVLEGAQAGLSWSTILKRRDGYRNAFHGFDPAKVANMTDEELALLLEDVSIIRNKLKILSARNNAIIFLEIQKEYGSFDAYLWKFVDNKPIVNYPKDFSEVAVTSEISDALSKDLRKRGMKFVGSTIMYAYMQAVGIVDDHLTDCWCKQTL